MFPDDDMIKSMNESARSIREGWERAIPNFNKAVNALNALTEGINEALRDFNFNLDVDHVKPRKLTVTEKLERYGPSAVDPYTLTPEARWEYQRWILSAPARAVQRFAELLKDWRY